MAKYNRNSGKPWTAGDVQQVKALAKQNTPTHVIGLKLGTSPYHQIRRSGKLISNDSTIIPHSFSVEIS